MTVVLAGAGASTDSLGMDRALAPFAILLLLVGCSGPAPGLGEGDDDDDDGGVIDEPDVPEPESNEIEIVTPELIIPAGQEILWCFFGVWEGETAGVTEVQVFDIPISHHTLIKSVPEEDPVPENFLIDCTAPTGDMSTYAVLFEGYTPEAWKGHEDDDDDHPKDDDDEPNDNLWLQMPEGLAVKMERGQRWMVDAHFINPGEEEVRTRITFQLKTVAPVEVESWVGAWTHHAQTLELPPHQITSRENTCEWSDEMSILSIGPHMHEFGWEYAVDVHRVDGTVERVLTREWWDPQWRLDPTIDYFAPGELVVYPGDRFTTTCTWNNTTDHVLDYPDEMCSTFGVATPLETAFECYGGVVNQGG